MEESGFDEAARRDRADYYEFIRAVSSDVPAVWHTNMDQQSPDSRAETRNAQEELLEFVSAISDIHISSADQESLREFVADIVEAPWAPYKHPRGGNPQNRGWFSKTPGSPGTISLPRGAATKAVYSSRSRVHAQLVAGAVGHHYVPVRVVFDESIRPFLSDEAVEYAMGAYSGKTIPPHAGGTYGEVTHPTYSARVKEELKSYIKLKKIKKMTLTQMEEFVGLMKNGQTAFGTPNREIAAFNKAIGGTIAKDATAPSKGHRGSRTQIHEASPLPVAGYGSRRIRCAE